MSNPMLSPAEVQFVWAAYYGAAIGIWCLAGIAIRNWYAVVFHLVLALLGALLFTPWYIADNQPELAPAITVLMFDILTGSSAIPFRASIPMTGVAIFLFIVFVLISLLLKLVKK